MRQHSILIVISFVVIILLQSCMTSPTSSTTTKCTIQEIHLSIDSLQFLSITKNPYSKGVEWEKECSFSYLSSTERHELLCGIRIHGGISRGYPKKSFRLYFRHKTLVSQSLFNNFPKYGYSSYRFDNLILASCARDFSYIRNYLSMYTTHKLGGYVPRIDYARLYINKKFYGLYAVIERIDKEYAHQITGHNNYDLLKSGTDSIYVKHNDNEKYVKGSFGNFLVGTWWDEDLMDSIDIVNNDSLIEWAGMGYEIKHGDTTGGIKDVILWLSSQDFSYKKLQTITTDHTIFGYYMGCYYSSDFDAYSKNYYVLYDNIKNTFSFLRWDGDVTFGRYWDGQPIDAIDFTSSLQRNGLFIALSNESEWYKNIKDKFISQFDNGFTNTTLARIDMMEKIIAESVQDDLNLWGKTLLNFFGAHNKNYWTINNSDIIAIWSSDLNYIRDYISNRQSEITKELSNY